ncbi:uncharacterized protein LOC134029238 [Osmerus eperlanus]|uniref:uncharacterized protein LOC134029238 n=1 Tax=Osmerus eperlanus TaxID=29151 RepID=UPI002E12DE81
MGNSHSEQEQPKDSSLGEDIEREKTIEPVVLEKTDEPTKSISKTRDAPPCSDQFDPMSDDLFQSALKSSNIGQGPCGPQASVPFTKDLPRTPSPVPTFSSVPDSPKMQHGDHRVIDITPDLTKSPVRPLAPEHKHPRSSKSQKRTPAAFTSAHAPPPPCQHKDMSEKAPTKPHAVEQKAAVRNPTETSTAPAKTQGPTKEQSTTKAPSETAPAPSGESEKNTAGSPESDKSLSFNMPPNFPLTKKTLEKLIENRFEYIMKQESIPPPPTPHRQAVVRRALNGEPYSEAVKGPVTKVNAARREAKAQKKARVSKSSNKQAVDPPGNDSSFATPSQPSSNTSEIPTPNAPTVTHEPFKLSVHAEPFKSMVYPMFNYPTATPVPSTPPVTQVHSTATLVDTILAADSGRRKHTTIPVPIKNHSSIQVPKQKKDLGNQAQVNSQAKAADSQGTRIAPNSTVKPAGSSVPHCCPKSEQGRAFTVKTRLQLKSKAQPINGNQGPPENTEAPCGLTKPVKPPSEKKSSQQGSSTLIKEKKSEPDPLKTTQAKYEAESEILMERFRKYSTEKSTKDSTQVTVTTHSEYHFYCGDEIPDMKCPCPPFTMPKMGDTSMYSGFDAFMEFCKDNPTTPTAVETQTNQSATSDVSPPTAPETAQGATTVTSQTQKREQPPYKAAGQDKSNKATQEDDEKRARPDVKENRRDEKPDEASPERPSRPEGLWHPFTVDQSCSRTAHCQHNNTALPRNVTKWLNVSRNYLCEPRWVTTATLAASLALKERLGGGECVL